MYFLDTFTGVRLTFDVFKSARLYTGCPQKVSKIVSFKRQNVFFFKLRYKFFLIFIVGLGFTLRCEHMLVGSVKEQEILPARLLVTGIVQNIRSCFDYCIILMFFALSYLRVLHLNSIRSMLKKNYT